MTTKKKLTVLRCPTCAMLVQPKDEDFPFCSDRCRKIDLGKWAADQAPDGLTAIEISTLQYIGIETLINSLKNIIGNIINLDAIPDAVISERHYHHLNQARHELKAASAAVHENADQLLAAHHVRQAINLLGALTGGTVTDDILSAIFSKFCVGK